MISPLQRGPFCVAAAGHVIPPGMSGGFSSIAAGADPSPLPGLSQMASLKLKLRLDPSGAFTELTACREDRPRDPRRLRHGPAERASTGRGKAHRVLPLSRRRQRQSGGANGSI